MPLTVNSTLLQRMQEDLKGYLEQGIADANRPNDVANTVVWLRRNRDRALNEIVKPGYARLRAEEARVVVG